MKEKIKKYEAPSLEIFTVKIENGFAASDPKNFTAGTGFEQLQEGKEW